MMKELFKNKSYFLLFQGSLVSAIGTSLYGFAAGLYVQDLFGEDGGAIYLALFMAISIIVNVIFSPIAGVFVDKWNRVRILYITDFIRGILFVGVFMFLGMGYDRGTIVTVLLITTALASFNQAFFGPASISLLPDVVGEDMIQQANGARSIIQSVQSIVGIIAGMFLFAILGFKVAVIFNAVSFIFSAISEMFIKVKPRVETSEIIQQQVNNDEDPYAVYDKDDGKNQPKLKPKTSFFTDFKFGFSYIFKKEGLLTMMLFSLMLNFAFTPLFSVGFPYLFRTELGKSAYHLGVTDIVFSITMLVAGVIIGSMKFPSLASTVKKGIVMLTSSFILSALLIVLVTYNVIGYNLFYGLFLFVSVLVAYTMMYTNIPLNTAMMKAVEPSVRGRVFSTIGALSTGAIPIAVILAGFVVDSYNVAILGIICSVLVGITTIGYISNPGITKMITSLEEPVVKPELVME